MSTESIEKRTDVSRGSQGLTIALGASLLSASAIGEPVALLTIETNASDVDGDQLAALAQDGSDTAPVDGADDATILIEPKSEGPETGASEDGEEADPDVEETDPAINFEEPVAISSNSVKDATGSLEAATGVLASIDASVSQLTGLEGGQDEGAITTQPITDPAEFKIELQKISDPSGERSVSVSVTESLSERFRELFTDFQPLRLGTASADIANESSDYKVIAAKFGSSLAEMALGLEDGRGTALLSPGSGDDVATNSAASPLDSLAAAGQSDAVVIDGKVVVDMSSADGDIESLRVEMEALGMTDTATWANTLSGLLPIDAIPEAALVGNLAMARPTAFVANFGSVSSLGDAAQGSDDARSSIGVDGSGQTVGVISDSFNALGGEGTGIASGDLPGAGNTNNSTPVLVLEDLPVNVGSDEGRAMAEIVHDVAPAANIQFHTAFLGAANFAQGIQDLIDAGSTVVVDDIGILTQPFFQDGVVAQSADQAVARGVPYFSAAGNSGTNSVEDTFRPSGTTVTYVNGSGQTVTAELHDWDSGAGVDTGQSVTIGANQISNMTFQWDEAFNSVANTGLPIGDYDLLILNPDGTVFETLSGIASNSSDSGDPLERFVVSNGGVNDVPFDLAVARVNGTTSNNFFKYTNFNSALTINEYNSNSATSFGHQNAQFAQGVAAVDYIQTAEFQGEFTSRGFPFPTPVVESFSSLGGIDILFDQNGNRLPTPEIRQGVDIAGPDGANTTFFGSDRTVPIPEIGGGVVDLEPDTFPNFFGTSAAAPHVAALAALMLDRNEAATPTEIFDALADTAIDVLHRENGPINTPALIPNGAGVDDFTGAGFVDANAAITQIAPSILITEIMYDPASPEDDWEWIEIYNNGLSTIDLTGWVLDDDDGVAVTGANVGAATLAPGDSGVLFNADDVRAIDFRAAWGQIENLIPVTEWSSLTLDNSGDTIGLWENFADYTGDNVAQNNALISQTYTDSAPFPVPDGSASIFLTDLSADPSNGTNWALSTVGGATPINTGYESANAALNSGTDVGSPGRPALIVTTVDDEDAGSTDLATEAADGNGLSLREAIAIANAGDGDGDGNAADTIGFADAPGEDFNGGGLIQISNPDDPLVFSSDITINGDLNADGTAEVTLDGVQISSLLSVTGGTANVAGLDIKNGTSGNGGAIHIASGATLNLSKSIVSDSKANLGGGIATDGTLNLTSALITRNRSDEEGGGIFASTGSRLSVINSTIVGNTGGELPFFGSGGGVFSDSMSTTIINSTITGNTSSLGGGGIETGGNAGLMTLNNSIILGNTSNQFGFTPLKIPDDIGSGSLVSGNNNVFGTGVVSGTDNVSGAAPADVFDIVNGTTGGGTLANNGGILPSVALEPNQSNPAIDGADTALLPADAFDLDMDGDTGETLPVDGRGLVRDVDIPNTGGSLDVGAFETQDTPTIGPDIISGTNGNDLLEAGDGGDLILAGDGIDLLRGGPGPDVLDGGAGLDFASYADFVGASLTIDLATPANSSLAFREDTLVQIDLIEGARNAINIFTGSSGADFFIGGNLNDNIDGNNGPDSLQGLGGNDTVNGGAGSDAIFGNSGNDRLTTQANDGAVDAFWFDDNDGFDTVEGFEVGTDLLGFFGQTINSLGSLASGQRSNGDAFIAYDLVFDANQNIVGFNAAIDIVGVPVADLRLPGSTDLDPASFIFV